MGDFSVAKSETQVLQTTPAPTTETSRGGTSLEGKASTQQNTVGNTEVQARMQKGAGETPAALPTPLPGSVGKITYYQDRNADYLRRHSSPPPPDYYLNYGNKYARRFTTILRPKLSAEGQKWLDKAFILLQNAIEGRLRKDRTAFASLERNNDEFRAFAYGTHPDAYLDAGLKNLGPSDLALIASTPDVADLATMDGVSQILETGVRLLPQWGGKAIDGAVDLGGKAIDGAVDLGGKAIDGAGKLVRGAAESIGKAWDWATDW
ncbi:MAG: hypothetical protein FJ090_12835 [Deltaproteobacteria bacterium]|nr:hypothetical protein [Deltaproteobacteria bacterium]